MIATTMKTASLSIAIPDESTSEQLCVSLPACYSIQTYTDITSLTKAIAKSQPELVLCHESLIDGSQALIMSEIRAASNNSLVLIMGPSRPISIQIQALKHGARGYFDESLSADRLHNALQLIMQGEVWVERHVISGLIDEITHLPQLTQEQRDSVKTLSPKEKEVANLVSHGATNKMIARAMNITERTVKAHLTTIFQKLDLPDRLSLAIFFRELR